VAFTIEALLSGHGDMAKEFCGKFELVLKAESKFFREARK
jgi:hypothetical protein